MLAEEFKKHWFLDRVTSSLGYQITLKQDRVEYSDLLGSLDIDGEWAPGSGTTVHLYSSSIPDQPARPRAEVLDRLQRAFSAAGWNLRVHA